MTTTGSNEDKTTEDSAEKLGLSVEGQGIFKSYGKGENATDVLHGIDVKFDECQMTSIMGPSGSGKSTLLHILAGLDSPSKGTVLIDDVDISRLNKKQKVALRRKDIGFIFQSHNLIPVLTAKENITLTTDLSHDGFDEEWFDKIIETMEIGDRLDHRPDQLSGGQQQKCAVARVLLQKPRILFADEPTGSIDSKNSKAIMDLLRTECVDKLGMTVIMVTHDPKAAAYADKCMILNDGLISDTVEAPTHEIMESKIHDLDTDPEDAQSKD